MKISNQTNSEDSNSEAGNEASGDEEEENCFPLLDKYLSEKDKLSLVSGQTSS